MEFVNIYSVRSIGKLLEALKGSMVRIGTDLAERSKSSRDIKNLCKGKPAIVVLGNEEHGISDESRKNCDELVIIPFAGMTRGAKNSPVDSLNVAQAASIVLYELSK